MLPDDQRPGKRRDVARGNTKPDRVGSRSSVKNRPGISDNDEVRVAALTLGNQMNRQKGLTSTEAGLGHGRSARWSCSLAGGTGCTSSAPVMLDHERHVGSA